MTHYAILAGASSNVEVATSYYTRTSGTGTQSVPSGYNAIHVQYAVGGGGGGLRGIDYDKAGGESSGGGGGAGAYISDKIFTVAAGETITWTVGAAGTKNGATYSGNSGSNGGQTKISGSSTGAVFTLNGGSRATITGNGGVQGPVRQSAAGSGGSVSHIDTSITSGTFLDSSYNVETISSSNSELKGGPRGTFNTSGSGGNGALQAGSHPNQGSCSGDNCQISGNAGGSSYAGAVAGGAAATTGNNGTNPAGNGSRGSGGGGGGAQGGSGLGGNGGSGEMKYRFLYVF